MTSDRMPLPPATFEFLIYSLRTQAEMQMGMLHFGTPEDSPEPDLELARHYIDLLGVLQEKTKGNLALEEERLLNNSITELRFRFVQASTKLTASTPAEEPLIQTPYPDDEPRIVLP